MQNGMVTDTECIDFRSTMPKGYLWNRQGFLQTCIIPHFGRSATACVWIPPGGKILRCKVLDFHRVNIANKGHRDIARLVVLQKEICNFTLAKTIKVIRQPNYWSAVQHRTLSTTQWQCTLRVLPQGQQSQSSNYWAYTTSPWTWVAYSTRKLVYIWEITGTTNEWDQ